MYYNLRLDWDPKVIGVKNGIYQVELDNRAYDKKSYSELESIFIGGKFSAMQKYPKVDFKFYFKKLKSAKKTDFMSFSPNINHALFLVNEKVIRLFEKFNIQSHKYFESVIYESPNECIETSYGLFYSVLQNWDVVDFENTVFTSGGFGINPIVKHKFVDENDMIKFNTIPKVKVLALSKRFDSSLDFFLTRLGGVFVSERLKIELERNNVTGVKFTNDVEILTCT